MTIKQILVSYKHQFNTLLEEVRRKETELHSSGIVSDVVKDFLSNVISENLPFTKTSSKRALDQYGRRQDDPFAYFRQNFLHLYNDLEDELHTYIILSRDGIKERKLVKTYISSAKTVKKLDTKIKHVISGIKELELISERIILKIDCHRTKLPTKKPQRLLSTELWKIALNNNLSEIQKMDETEYYDRKRQFVENKKNEIEDLVVSIANTIGGVIAYGIDDDKNVTPLNHKHRDKIQNQIVSLCTDKIQNPIHPKFHTILIDEETDLGAMFVFIPKFTKHHHCTSAGKYLHRIGSNNKPIPPGKIK
jgi:hypothetical protein